MNKLRYSEMFYSLQGEGRYVGVPSIFLRLFGCNFECTGFGQDRDRSKWIPKENMPHNQDYPDAKALVDLPVPQVGCDSSFSWGKKWGHLANYEDIDTIIKKMNVLDFYGEKRGASDDLKENDGVHLVMTGGEPLLKGFQPAVSELITHPDLKTRYVTFETNGTQQYHFDDFQNDNHDRYLAYYEKYAINRPYHGITWSVSPKLQNSGERWIDAIVPEALLSYNTWPGSYLYLKFVVRDYSCMYEVTNALKEYEKAGVMIDAIYLMPEGALDHQMEEKKIAEIALSYGYKYSPRLQLNLFGNEWGT